MLRLEVGLGRSFDILGSENPLEVLRYESRGITMLVHVLGEWEPGKSTI